MARTTEFGEIDFKEIEYRNEYRYTGQVFVGVGASIGPVVQAISVCLREELWLPLGALCAAYALALSFLLVKLRSRVLITGSGITLKRPLLKDIEIPYSEVGEISLNNRLIGDQGSGLITLDLSEALAQWGETSSNRVTIKSIDGSRKIAIEQSLENFGQFCNDLFKRMRLAEERYQGYAKGTHIRQPERTLRLKEALRGHKTTRQING